MAITYYSEQVDELSLIERFFSGKEPASSEAFRELAKRIRPFLGKYLYTLLPIQQDREDAIESVLQKLLLRQHGFEVRSVGAWWVYVATIARRCAYDHLKEPVPAEWNDDLPEHDVEIISKVAEFSEDRERLYALADELWLETDTSLSLPQRRRRLLACQLHFLHNMPWKEVCNVVSNGTGMDRATLNDWLSQRGVLNQFSYHCLYHQNDALVGYLLCPRQPLNESQLDRLERDAARSLGTLPDDWTWPEIKVVLWRYRNGLSTTKILQMDPTLTPAVVERAVTKCTNRLPFRRIAAKVADALRTSNIAYDPLRCPGLWKRLAFQYHTFHELPHKQILERTEPAAHESGFVLTPGMLNVWLSNGRLFQQLASYASRSNQHGH